MTTTASPPAGISLAACRWNLLDEPLIRWRSTRGALHHASLPGLLALMAGGVDGCVEPALHHAEGAASADAAAPGAGAAAQLAGEVAGEVLRDFPALRPHQRHPWHAFLVQLAVIALHHAGQAQPWRTAQQWREALLALTPDYPSAAPWCLVAPADQPALLQPRLAGTSLVDLDKLLRSADELDMLVTSKNHDLKTARARHAQPDDWLFALVSLQTQEGFMGRGNYGISRMNGGLASRPGVGVQQQGASWAQRWQHDVARLLGERAGIASMYKLRSKGGHALLWLLPWAGGNDEALAMSALDPMYIEICRRVRLSADGAGGIQAHAGTSDAARVAAQGSQGVTGDAWTPVELQSAQTAKALTVSAKGLDYKLMNDLITGQVYRHGAAWHLDGWPDGTTLEVIAQVVVRGQGKTEGYHERRIPIPPKMRRRLGASPDQRTWVAQVAKKRIDAIAGVKKLLWSALMLLLSNGSKAVSDKDLDNNRANRFAQMFEQQEDGRFFADLACEVEAPDEAQSDIYLQWLLALEARAEAVLRHAFATGPRSAMRRYEAQSGALSYFQFNLRYSPKAPIKQLAHHYKSQRQSKAQSHGADVQHA